jgi:hypothetical protein
MEGKTHQNLKTCVGQKSSNGEMASGRAIKERKRWESSRKKEGGERERGWEKRTPAPAHGPRMNL